jgi:hypothetical protein
MSKNISSYGENGKKFTCEKSCEKYKNLHDEFSPKSTICNCYSITGRKLTDAEIKERARLEDAAHFISYAKIKKSWWIKLKEWFKKEKETTRRIWESK